MLAIIGDQFSDCDPEPASADTADGETGARGKESTDVPEICGCTISVRQNEDIISIWNHIDADAKVKEKIRCVLHSPLFTVLF